MVAAAAVMLAGCTGDNNAADGTGTQPQVQPSADAERVPEFCDQLMSTLVPAEALDQLLPPGRIYTRLGPDPQTGRLVGLRCAHGVDPSGPRLTVTASEFESRGEARTALDRSLSPPESAPVLVQGHHPGALVASSGSTSLTALDGDCLVRARLSTGVVDQDRTEQSLRAITRALLDGIEGRAA